jgi:DNA-directed RNA polymerase subunit M/transcription elongation factor TFIIS
MNFCEKCDNLYYLRFSEDKSLFYFCRNCGDEKGDVILEDELCISSYEEKPKQTFSKINEYTKYDPTLPHSHTIRCPNQECKSNKDNGVNSDVIYLRVDDINMKFMYLCVNCDISWTP